MKKLLLIPIILAFAIIGVADIQKQKQLNEALDTQINEQQLDLIDLEKETIELNNQIDEQTVEDKAKIEQLEKERKRLEAELQAKLEREEQEQLAQAQLASASDTATGSTTVSAEPVTYGGNKQDWLAASGIPQEHWVLVDMIVARESGWDPNAINPESGACGLGQQLPCGKWPGAWNDPVAALKAQHQYVTERYGGYPQAMQFWNVNHWY